MTQGRPWAHIIKFSLPLLAGAVLQQLYSTVDTVVVGHFTGESALAAVGTTNTLIFFFLAVAIGFSAGNGVLIAQHFGAGRMDDVRRDASTGLLLLLLIGLISGCTGILFSRWAYVKFVAVPPEILDSTLLYYRIYCAGLIFQFAYNSLAAILRSVASYSAISRLRSAAQEQASSKRSMALSGKKRSLMYRSDSTTILLASSGETLTR